MLSYLNKYIFWAAAIGTRNQYVFFSCSHISVGTDQSSACMVDSVRWDLLQEETDARKTGTTYLHERTPSLFVQHVLDVEERRYVLTYKLPPTQYTDSYCRWVMCSSYKDSDASTLIKWKSLHDQCHLLTQAIKAFHSPQWVYMPGVSHLLNYIDPELVTNTPEHTKLWLPNSCSPKNVFV